ncbi:TIGR00730 family Rossman fold protein [Acetobacteraceae bacterium]|nr:TIGR00730 family Rossman fold protein [Acetobacteraceae bacterium]
MIKFDSCAVFCGSRFGNDPAFRIEAEKTAQILAKHKITLIYGGGNTGLMGVVATSCLEAGGKVKGIIPTFLTSVETAHPDVTDLEITENMAIRKIKMIKASDASIILPGGLGTFDELLEVLVERQLGLSQKPIFLLNIQGWANPLLEAFQAAIAQGFADQKILDFLEIFPTADAFENHLSA